MMPQSQNADYSNGSNNNAMGIAVAPQNSPYNSNSSMPGHLPMLNPSIQNQNLIAAAMHLNQSNQGYITPGLATIGYIYPNNNSFVQASNLVFNSQNILHPPVEMIPSGPSSLGHVGSGGSHHNNKLSGYDNMQHFGSLSQNPSRKPKNSVMSKTNLYINGLNEQDTDESVRALVKDIIDPKSCKAMMSHGKCRGSGFIDCASESDAEIVIPFLRNKQMPGGTRLAVKFAYENEKDDLNVYVRNLPRTSNFSNVNLEDMFKEFGQVVSVKLLQSDNQYTGTGFVRFSTAEEAQKAVDQMNVRRLVLTEEDKPVICKLADKGGRRMNHSMLSEGSLLHSHQHHHSQSMEGDHVANGTLSQISPEGTDKSGYGMAALAGHQFGPQGHPWINHTSPDQLAQELQSLGLVQNASYLLPALMQGPLAMPYNDEAAIQQQLLAQLLWAHQNPSRMMASSTGYHPSQMTQHPQQHQQQQPVIHWPQHQIASNGLYYTAEPSYQPLVYPQQQFRQSRPAIVASLKSPSNDAAMNGQGPSSSSQCLMNGTIGVDQQQHQ